MRISLSRGIVSISVTQKEKNHRFVGLKRGNCVPLEAVAGSESAQIPNSVSLSMKA